MFVSFPKNELPHKSQERHYARLIHESSCFKSFLLILTYSCGLFTAQLSKKSKSYPVSCCLLEKREKRGKGGIAILLAGNPQKCLLLPFKMSLHNNSTGKKMGKKSKTVHLEHRLHKAKLTNLHTYLQICPKANTW